jgi:hypothetical protein
MCSDPLPGSGPAPGRWVRRRGAGLRHRGSSEVNTLIAEAAEATVEKLVPADADERHLFVWIAEDAAELEMFALLPLASAPALPDGDLCCAGRNAWQGFRCTIRGPLAYAAARCMGDDQYATRCALQGYGP